MTTTHKALKRWQHNRFGMFIHWGLYALAARHEWVKKHENQTDKEYQPYFDNFNPDLYDPAAWARACKKAGMKYVVLTTKHHEGFCLWDTKHTDYKAPNTPCGRDLLKPFVEAFRNEGIRIGWYYSLLDWHHPEYTTDVIHPQAGDEKRKAGDKRRDFRKYAAYMRNQVTELLSGYGDIDMIFYDFSHKDPKTGKTIRGRNDWESEKLIALTRKLQPGILVNDRLDLPGPCQGGDFITPEQFQLEQCPMHQGKPLPWETCQTFSGSWGYHRDEQTWKSTEQLVKLLVDTVSKNGNLLLNVGPTARGTFDARALERLHGIGTWMDLHGRSVYGCGPAPKRFTAPRDCRLTYDKAAKRLYIHVFSWPSTGQMMLPGAAGKAAYAQLLNDASELKTGKRNRFQLLIEKGRKNDLVITVPIRKPDVTVPVIEITLTH